MLPVESRASVAAGTTVYDTTLDYPPRIAANLREYCKNAELAAREDLRPDGRDGARARADFYDSRASRLTARYREAGGSSIPSVPRDEAGRCTAPVPTPASDKRLFDYLSWMRDIADRLCNRPSVISNNADSYDYDAMVRLGVPQLGRVLKGSKGTQRARVQALLDQMLPGTEMRWCGAWRFPSDHRDPPSRRCFRATVDGGSPTFLRRTLEGRAVGRLKLDGEPVSAPPGARERPGVSFYRGRWWAYPGFRICKVRVLLTGFRFSYLPTTSRRGSWIYAAGFGAPSSIKGINVWLAKR